MEVSEQRASGENLTSTPPEPPRPVSADPTATPAANDAKPTQKDGAIGQEEDASPPSIQSHPIARSATRQGDEDPDSEIQQEVTGTAEKTDEELSSSDWKAAADELDDNIDEAFGQAAQSFWNLASSVTGTMSSAVTETPALNQLRQNVTSHLGPLDTLGQNLTSHLGPLDSLGQNLTSRLEALAPADRVANLAGSVKSVAQTVQRNAQEMERAILSTANAGASMPPSHAALAMSGDVMLPDDAIEPRGKDTSTQSVKKTHVGNAAPREMEDADANASATGEESTVLRVEDEIAKVGEIVGSSLGKTVGGLWNGLWGGEEEEGGWELANGGGDSSRSRPEARVPTTRFEKKIFELQGNPNTYCEPVDDLDGFETWGKSFTLDVCAEECIEILSTHDAIAELYERVVPEIVEEDMFWMRYFYSKHVLEAEEERRKRLLERAENGVVNDNDVESGWGDDDWGDDDADGGKDGGDKEGEDKDGETSVAKIAEEGKTDSSEGVTEMARSDEGMTEDADKTEGVEAGEAQSDDDCKSSKSVEGEADQDEKDADVEKRRPVAETKTVTVGKGDDGEDDWGDDWE